MNEFLNPKSMLTPGVAGGVVVILVNGLSAPFPELPQRYLALGISFLLGGLAVLQAVRMGRGERVLYWVANSLVIFAVGFGSNSLAREATGSGAPAAPVAAVVSALLPRAYAQPARTEPGAGGDQQTAPPPAAARGTGASEDPAQLEAQVEALRAENARMAAEVKKLEEEKKAKQQQAERERFFKKW